MKISVVISSFDGAHLLKQYLPYLWEALKGFENEVIVVDDGSKDDTAEFVQKKYPFVKLIRLDGNKGFAAANNAGAKMSSGDIILFLNNDVKVTKDFLESLCRHFENQSVFAVSPRVVNTEHNVNEGFSRGRFCRGSFVLEFPESNGKRICSDPTLSLYATGSAMLVDRKKFLSLGGFDSMFYPFYCEDMDLGYRAWKRGWNTIYEPKSVVYHYHQATIGRLLPQRKIETITGKNQLLFMWKNLTDDRLFLSHWLWLPRNIIGGLRMGNSAYLRNFVYALPRLPAAVRARRREKRAFVRGDGEVFAVLAQDKKGYPDIINTRAKSDRFLVIMPQSLGDVYQMTGVVNGLKKKYPDKRIDFMTKKRCVGILWGNPDVQEIIPYPEESENPYQVTEFQGLPGREKLIEKYEKIYTPYHRFQLTYENLMRNKRTGKSMVELFAEACGLERNEIGEPYLREDEFPINENNYIVVHPKTRDDAKNWSYFPRLAKMLVKNGFSVYQVGISEDGIMDDCKDYRALAFGELAYLLRKSKLFIGVDSFPAHLAGAVGTKTMILYGGTDADFCRPYWGEVTVLEPDRAKFGCKEACHAKSCRGRHKCINGISPKEVYENVVSARRD